MANLITTLRSLCQRTLPTIAFERVRIWWWYASICLPHLVCSFFVSRLPEVHCFGGERSESQFVMELQKINTLAATRMCRVMTKCGSDKGRAAHNYTTVYSQIFAKWHDRPLRIIELGLGTHNLEVPSNMGAEGVPGASVRGWRKLFPHALVYGADVDRAILFEEDRIKTFYCDQCSPLSIRELWSQPDLRDGADIIIEDGLHTFDANVTFMEESLGHLHVGGIYVVEDIDLKLKDRWQDRFRNVYSERYPSYEFTFVALPNPLNAYGDNNLLVVRRIAN